MVVLVSKEGQLANRLFHASSFIVNAQEHHYSLRHSFFDDYYPFFSESLNENKTQLRCWGKKSSFVVRLRQRMLTLLTKVLLKLKIRKLPFFEIIENSSYEQGAPSFDLNDKAYLQKAKSKIVFISGWLFRDSINFEKHKDLLINLWRPNTNFQNNIGAYYKKYKQDHDVLIGVHMRGGDYKKFEGGKWYYTPEEYYQKIKEVADLKIVEGKKPAFVICSNEKVSIAGTEKFSVYNESRHFIEDLYLLSKCDYIIGPPSTFSMWASFYGAVPLYAINNIKTPIELTSFKVVNS